MFLVFAFELIARFRGQHDFDAMSRGELPPFAREPAYLGDGGSVEYSGFGYTVTRMHRIWPLPVRPIGWTIGIALARSCDTGCPYR
jgi:hypothetical protein